MNSKVVFDIKKSGYDIVIISFKLLEELSPLDLNSIEPPDPTKNCFKCEVPLLCGKAPIWFYNYLIKYYRSLKAVAVYDSKLNSGIIVESNSPNYKIGDLIELVKFRTIKLKENIFIIEYELSKEIVFSKELEFELPIKNNFSDKVIILSPYGPIAKDVGTTWFLEYLIKHYNKAKALGLYEIRSNIGVIIKSNSKDYKIGDLFKIDYDILDLIKLKKIKDEDKKKVIEIIQEGTRKWKY